MQPLRVIASANSLGPDRVAILHAPAPWSCTRLLITSRAHSRESESDRPLRSFCAHAAPAGDRFSQLTWSRPSCNLACASALVLHAAADHVTCAIARIGVGSSTAQFLRACSPCG